MVHLPTESDCERSRSLTKFAQVYGGLRSNTPRANQGWGRGCSCHNWRTARRSFYRAAPAQSRILTAGVCRGAEDATREILRSLSSHFERESQNIPESVAKALNAANAASLQHRKPQKGASDPNHAQPSILGDAIGAACWLKGHTAGIRRKAPAPGKIRVDLSLDELLQPSWLAHIGFQHIMPNYRGLEIYRFSGEEDTQEGAKAVWQDRD